MHGAAQLSFRRSGDATRLLSLYHHAPLRVLFPAADEPQVAPAVLVTTSGGIAGGDRLDVRLHATTGATVQVTTQAAEKVYRSLGADAHIAVDVQADADAWLEWLPQETILFDHSRLSRRTRIEAASGARVLTGEMLAFGRTAHAETFAHGRLRDAFEVYRDGRLVWADALNIEGDVARTMAAPACLAGATAAAMLLYVGADAENALSIARDLTAADRAGDMLAAATCVAGVLVVRWLGADARLLRNAFGRCWVAMRSELGGFAAALPRVWQV